LTTRTGNDKSIAGAVLGASAGLLLAKGKLLGLAAGAVVGYLIQRNLKAARTVPGPPPQPGDPDQAVRRARSLVRLGFAVASCDGLANPAELEALRRYFERDAALTGTSLELARQLISEAITGVGSIETEARAMPHLDPKDRVHVVMVLFRVAFADGELNAAEDDALLRASDALGMSRNDFVGVRTLFVAEPEGGGLSTDYRVLGLEPGARPDEVKAKYREAVKAYHPDKFQHLGDEFTAVAADKFKRIQEAYERLIEGMPSAPPARRSLCPQCRGYTQAVIGQCSRCGHERYSQRNGKVHLQCPFCTQTNAFPATALKTLVRCGNCRVLLVR